MTYTAFCYELHEQADTVRERACNDLRCVEIAISLLNNPPLSSLEGTFLHSLAVDLHEYLEGTWLVDVHEYEETARVMTEPERDTLLFIVHWVTRS